jgi:hypothetical protein
MDDRFLHEWRRTPDPRFARDLRDRLRGHEARPAPRRMAPLIGAAAAAATIVVVFAVPSVRASAEAFLDLFRIRKFAAVEFNESRLETLRSLGKDRTLFVFDRAETVQDPGPRRHMPTVELAAAEAGLAVRTPTYLPRGMTRDSIFVGGDGRVVVSVSEPKLRALLDQLALRDVAIPSGLDGRRLELHKPPVVFQEFRSERHRLELVQARSPEVAVPAGLDVERLAEIGLRVLGLDAGEARRIARATDWRSTLIVPVPMNASTFRQVTVRGQSGLLITTAGSAGGGRRREGTVVLWSEAERVYGLETSLGPSEAMQVAESVR